MPRESLLLLVICAAACADEPAVRVVQENRTGRYSFGMTAPDLPAIAYSLGPTVLAGADVVPACCLGFWDRDRQTFELYVGNWVADPAPGPDGECPAVAAVRLTVPVVPDGPPQRVDLAAAEVALVTSGTGPCPHAAADHGALDPRSADLAPRGHLDLERLDLDCGGPTDDLGCALTTSGTFTFTAVDPAGTTVITAAGSFAAADDVLSE